MEVVLNFNAHSNTYATMNLLLDYPQRHASGAKLLLVKATITTLLEVTA